MRVKRIPFAAACIVVGALASVSGQSGAQSGEWRSYGGDIGHTRYSPLDQINAGNFGKLEVAGRFKTDNLGPRPEFQFESTPLMVKGVVYSTGGSRRAVVALDAATGEMLWMHSENEGARGANAPRQLSGRGLAYWSDNAGDDRILYVTPGYRLIALNAKTGAPIATFGERGVVDLKKDDDQEMDLITGEVGLHSTPTVAKNVVIVGAAHKTGGNPKSRRNEKGYVRGFDVRSGKRLWIFHTIPMQGEFGFDTWEKDSWSYTGNAGVWGQISADEELGLVYLPVELPTGDYYGADRPGNGLFGESLVAVDLRTGQRKWHYQLVHHGLWDMDIPCPPILTDITIGGRTVKALAQPTKQAILYVFNRETGQPIWPIEERPVPKGDVPGEWYSPTQPVPTRPPAFDQQGVADKDLLDYTPELKAESKKIVDEYNYGPLYTPPEVAGTPKGKKGTIFLPGTNGGADWGGAAFDPETGILYVPSTHMPDIIGLVHSEHPESNMPWVKRAWPKMLGPQGLPDPFKPPYAKLTAIDLNKGEILWAVANGDGLKNHPAFKGLNLPAIGTPGRNAAIVTKSLVFMGEGSDAGVGVPAGFGGKMFRAFDKKTGRIVWEMALPAGVSNSPMTYMVNGKQYILVAVSGRQFPGELVALALP